MFFCGLRCRFLFWKPGILLAFLVVLGLTDVGVPRKCEVFSRIMTPVHNSTQWGIQRGAPTATAYPPARAIAKKVGRIVLLDTPLEAYIYISKFPREYAPRPL